jgi:uncharacterized membrane protein
MTFRFLPSAIKKQDILWVIMSSLVIIETCHGGYAPVGWMFITGHFYGYFETINEILFFVQWF